MPHNAEQNFSVWNGGEAVGSIRAAVVAVCGISALALLPGRAAAQFTTALVPPPAPLRIDTVARADSVKKAADELQERMTSIKEWVDSAAAALAAQPAQVPPVSPDSARVPRMPAMPDSLRARPTVPPDTSADTSASRPRRAPPG